MGARALGRLSALACVAFAAASVGVAQPAPANPGGVELRYEAFEGCPEREAFAQNLEARRRGAVTSRAVRLEVRLSRAEAQRVAGSIVVSSDGGAPSARRIVAATCGEAADALALIAALALQGIEVEDVPAGDEQSERRGERRADRARTSEADRARERPSEAQRDAGAEAAGAPEATPEVASEPASESERDSATEADVIDERAEAKPDERLTDTEEDDPDDPSAQGSSRAYVLLSGGVAAGVLPALQPLPELSLSWEHAAHGFPLWSVHAAFRIAPEQTRRFDQGVVAMSWWTGMSAVCLGARSSQLSASGCVALELGALSSAATETDNPRDKRRAWVALGPGGTIAYDPTQALRIQLRAELLTPLTRYRLELPQGIAVHEPAVLGLRAELGVGLRLW